MPTNRVIPLHSTDSGSVPAAGNMAVGELVVNVTDGILYTKNANGDIVLLSPYVVSVNPPAITNTYSSASFDVYTLSTERASMTTFGINEIAATMVSGTITLPKGTYSVMAHCGLYGVGSSFNKTLQLYNITDDVTISGMTAAQGTFANNYDVSTLMSAFTITTPKTYEFRVTGTGAPQGKVEAVFTRIR